VAFLLLWLGLIALVVGSEFETLDCGQQSAECVSLTSTLLLFRVRHSFPVEDLAGVSVSSEMTASKWSRHPRSYFLELRRKSTTQTLILLPKRHSASDPALRQQLANFEAFLSGQVPTFSYSSGFGWFHGVALVLALCLIAGSVWQAARAFEVRRQAMKSAAVLA
jgi:hypothetical protein